jgi:hypothetical protein
MYTIQEKTRPTWHIRFPHQSTYAWHTLLVDGPHTWQLFTRHRQSWTESLLLRKMTPDTIHSTPTDRSTSPYPVSLLSQTMKQRRKSNICRQQATRLTGPISPICNQYVQYLLTGTNPRSLTDTNEGYHTKSRNSHNTFPALLFRVFHWSPYMGPPDLYFIQH